MVVVKEPHPYHIPGDVVHSGKTQDAPAEIIEVFSPAREDLMRD